MKTIWKFPLQITDHQEVSAPSGYWKPLSVQVQGSDLCLWAEVDNDMGMTEPRRVAVRMSRTGDTIHWHGDLKFVGTVQVGPLVWHVYAEKAS
jgi:hypothetical protein